MKYLISFWGMKNIAGLNWHWTFKKRYPQKTKNYFQ